MNTEVGFRRRRRHGWRTALVVAVAAFVVASVALPAQARFLWADDPCGWHGGQRSFTPSADPWVGIEGASVCADGAVRVVNRGDLGFVHTHRRYSAAAFTPDDTTLALLGVDGTVDWVGPTNHLLAAAAAHLSPLRAGVGIGLAFTPDGTGLWRADSRGMVTVAGTAPDLGHPLASTRFIGFATTMSGAGYWLLADDGTVYAFGDAVAALGGRRLVRVTGAVSVSRAGDSLGTWIATSSGTIRGFGSASSWSASECLKLHPGSRVTDAALSGKPGSPVFAVVATDVGALCQYDRI